MKKVLVIGAGRGQIPVMDICHSYGYKVIAVSPSGNYPGLNIADEVFYADVKEKEKILEYAKKQSIDAVLTDQLDAGVATVAYIAENMNLPGNPYNVALKFTNKYIMRKAAQQLNIDVPKCAIIKDINNIENDVFALEFPLMMKPVDSAASRGVYKVNTIEELKNKFIDTVSYSSTGEVIVEEFIEGKEYVVEAYTSNKAVTNLIVGHRDYFNIPDTFIPNATVFVDANSAQSNLEKRIKEINIRLVEGFGLNFGITHAEYIYNEQRDKIYLVEIAARGGGVFISSDLIPSACGVNAYELLVRDALGIIVEKDITLQAGASAYFCYLTPTGVISEIRNTDIISDIPGVRKAFFDNVNVGMYCLSIKDKSSRKGPILVFGKTKKECYDIIDAVKEKLIIKISDDGEEKDIIWN